jgi:hypothetical protein
MSASKRTSLRVTNANTRSTTAIVSNIAKGRFMTNMTGVAALSYVNHRHFFSDEGHLNDQPGRLPRAVKKPMRSSAKCGHRMGSPPGKAPIAALDDITLFAAATV